MMQEWTRWQPIEGLVGSYCIESFSVSEQDSDDWDFVVTLLSNDRKQKIKIFFEYGCDVYRYTNKRFSDVVLDGLSERYGQEFYSDWSFFTITNSEYMSWISKKSATWSDEQGFVHYCIIGDDQILDILSYDEPVVKFIEENQN